MSENRINPLTVASTETDAKLAPIERAPLVPPALMAIATLLAPVLLVVSAFVPPPFGQLVFVLSFIAAFLAGKPLPQPKWVASKPLVPLAAVPVLGGSVPALVQLAEALPGNWKALAYIIALVASWLAGVASPAPLK